MPYLVRLRHKDGIERDDFPVFRGRTPKLGDELDLGVNGDIVRARGTGISPGPSLDTAQVVAEEV